VKLPEFKFLTDENISSLVVQFLRDCQLDVFDVKENLLSGRRDSFLLDLAVKQQRVVVTQDSDFGFGKSLLLFEIATGFFLTKPVAIFAKCKRNNHGKTF